jgi:hypothetical protein
MPACHLGWDELLHSPPPSFYSLLFFLPLTGDFKKTNGRHTSVSPSSNRFFFLRGKKKKACPGKTWLLKKWGR